MNIHSTIFFNMCKNLPHVLWFNLEVPVFSRSFMCALCITRGQNINFNTVQYSYCDRMIPTTVKPQHDHYSLRVV